MDTESNTLYRRRISFAAFLAALGLGTIVGMWPGVSIPEPSLHNALMLMPGVLLLVAAWLAFRVARSSRALDLGLTGPEEYRELVAEAAAWKANGYRTPAEVANGVPPRSKPPNLS